MAGAAPGADLPSGPCQAIGAGPLRRACSALQGDVPAQGEAPACTRSRARAAMGLRSGRRMEIGEKGGCPCCSRLFARKLGYDGLQAIPCGAPPPVPGCCPFRQTGLLLNGNLPAAAAPELHVLPPLLWMRRGKNHGRCADRPRYEREWECRGAAPVFPPLLKSGDSPFTRRKWACIGTGEKQRRRLCRQPDGGGQGRFSRRALQLRAPEHKRTFYAFFALFPYNFS